MVTRLPIYFSYILPFLNDEVTQLKQNILFSLVFFIYSTFL